MSKARPNALARLLPVGALALAVLAPEGTARASGFLSDQFGSDQGDPALGNVYAVYFNPAAMAGMHGSEITLDGVIAARSLDYTRSPSALTSTGAYQGSPGSYPYYQGSNSGKATLFNVLSAPFGGFVTDFGGSHARLGVAAYVPFGGAATWGKNQAYANSTEVPGGYDGPQRWSSISASTYSIYTTAAFAYRFDKPRIGLGLSVSGIYSTLQDTRARDASGTDDIVASNGQILEGRTYIDEKGAQIGASAGLYWEATKDGALRFGASYTSAPNFGTMRLKGNFQFSPGITSESTTSADLLEAYPDIIRWGAAWRVSPQTELRLDGDWERWSNFKDQCVVQSGSSCPTNSQGVATGSNILLDLPRNWKDSFKVRLGIGYWVTPDTELHASASWNSAPVDKHNEDPLIYDSTRLAGTVGVRHGFNRHFYGALSYTYIYVLPLTVNDSAYPTYASPSNSPSTNGDYSSQLYVFDVALGYRF
jgi:long-chain fatty acid transport protein